MTGSRDLAGISQPDHKLCKYWVTMREAIRHKAAQVRYGTLRPDEYASWALAASSDYAAHVTKCSHPQHANPSYGYDSARRGLTAVARSGNYTRKYR